MTAATSTRLESKFGPIVADAAGTITVQEASDVLEYSRFRVCELLNPTAGRVLVTDVLALESSELAERTLGSPRCKARRAKPRDRSPFGTRESRRSYWLIGASCEPLHRVKHAPISTTKTTTAAFACELGPRERRR